MPGLKLTSPEQLQETQRKLREEVKPPAVTNKNVSLATNLEADALLSYRKVLYTVAPVPYPAGLRLQEIHVLIGKLGDIEEQAIKNQDTEQLHVVYDRLKEVMTEGRNIYRTLIRPKSLGRRLVWRWLSNPFANCSQTEFGELLNFFSECRTRSGIIVLLSSANQPSLSSRTLPETSLPSSKPSLVQGG